MKDIYEFAYGSKAKLTPHRQRVTQVDDNKPGHDVVHAFKVFEADGLMVNGRRRTLPNEAFHRSWE